MFIKKSLKSWRVKECKSSYPSTRNFLSLLFACNKKLRLIKSATICGSYTTFIEKSKDVNYARF